MHPPEYRFCPVCGGPLETRRLKAADPERLVCPSCGFVFYMDPKVAVGTIITHDDGRIVLVRRAIEPGYGLWVFPGGYVDRGELCGDDECLDAALFTADRIPWSELAFRSTTEALQDYFRNAWHSPKVK